MGHLTLMLTSFSHLPVSLDHTSSTLSSVYITAGVLIALWATWYWQVHAVRAKAPSPNIPVLPGAQPILGHSIEVLHNMPRLHDWMLGKARQMNYKTFAFSLPFLPAFHVVMDPLCLEYILKTKFQNYIKGETVYTNFEPLLGHGIFASDGPQWLWQRKLAAHMFNVNGFKRYINVTFGEKMDHCTRLLQRASSSNSPVDLHDLMYRFTLDSFAQIGFGVDPGSLRSESKVPFAAAFDEAQVIVNARFWVPAWPLVELLNGHRSAVARNSAAVKQFALGIIQKRRASLQAAAAVYNIDTTGNADNNSDGIMGDSGDPPRDLLSMFMGVRGPDGRLLDDRQLVDTVLNFIIAGRDTTAQALSWTFYCLLQHPEVQQKLLAEMQDVLGQDAIAAVKPSYDQLRQLRYARACFLEALRLYPSVPQNVKYAVQADTLPDGSIIPAGAQVLYPPYVVNRMTTLWGEDADCFRPERWIEMDNTPSPYSYPTFHAGPRLCLGQRLAELEGLYVLTGLLARFKFKAARPLSNVTYALSTTMPMKDGLHVLVEPRG